MNKTLKNKRGFTLAELCVVMALIAVAALLMTSFMAVFHTRTAQNTVRHDFLDEVALVRDEMQKWIEANDFNSAELVVSPDGSDDGLILYRGSNEANKLNYNVVFMDGVLLIKDYTTNNVQLSLKAVKKITLSAYVTATGADPLDTSGSGKLLRCTLTGEDNFGNEFSQDLIFSLDSEAKFVNGQND